MANSSGTILITRDGVKSEDVLTDEHVETLTCDCGYKLEKVKKLQAAAVITGDEPRCSTTEDNDPNKQCEKFARYLCARCWYFWCPTCMREVL